MKKNPYRITWIALIGLYAIAIFVTWLRKHTIDGDLVFWAAMSILLFSSVDLIQEKK